MNSQSAVKYFSGAVKIGAIEYRWSVYRYPQWYTGG
jgi:hypothetical protein